MRLKIMSQVKSVLFVCVLWTCAFVTWCSTRHRDVSPASVTRVDDIKVDGTVQLNTNSEITPIVFSTKKAAGTDGQNIFIGSNPASLSGSGPSASSNVSLGYGALNANTTGAYNTAIGHTSLPLNTTGGDNTGLGQNTLSRMTTGRSNTAVGVQALQFVQTYDNNTAVGLNALELGTLVAGCTALGAQAGQSYGNGINAFSSIFIGVDTARLLPSGNGNTIIGTEAFNTITADSDLNTIVGRFAGQSITSGRANTLVGAYTGTASMSNNVILSDGDGVRRFQSDSSGNVTNMGGTKNKGTITLAAGTGTATVNTGAICVCDDSTAVAAVRCAVAGTTLTATGTGADVIAYLCF